MSPLKKWYRFNFVLLCKTSIVFTSVDETTVSLLDFLNLKHDSEFGKPQYFFFRLLKVFWAVLLPSNACYFMRSDLEVCYPDGRNRIWNCAVVANISNPLAIGSEGGKSEDQSCFSYEVCWGQPRLTILCTKSTNALKKN